MDKKVMKKIIVFGNSGSGKSTLAAKLNKQGLAHLDLDTLAWLDSSPPMRKDMASANEQIQDFITRNEQWVIEGCYADLLSLVSPMANEAVFMNLPVKLCIENAKNRPWESHKYPSKEAQDNNLAMLIEWISDYTVRKDSLSYEAHHDLYKNFDGNKIEIVNNQS